jgi:hypothetical protein
VFDLTIRNPNEQEIMDKPAERSSKPPSLKKPYVKPAFRYEKVFETQALSCSKIAVTSGICQAGAQKTS